MILLLVQRSLVTVRKLCCCTLQNIFELFFIVRQFYLTKFFLSFVSDSNQFLQAQREIIIINLQKKKKKKRKTDLFIIWIFMLFRKMFLFRLVGSNMILPGMFERRWCRSCILLVGCRYSQGCCQNWYWMRRSRTSECHGLLRMQGHMKSENIRNMLCLNCVSLSEAV